MSGEWKKWTDEMGHVRLQIQGHYDKTNHNHVTPALPESLVDTIIADHQLAELAREAATDFIDGIKQGDTLQGQRYIDDAIDWLARYGVITNEKGGEG